MMKTGGLQGFWRMSWSTDYHKSWTAALDRLPNLKFVILTWLVGPCIQRKSIRRVKWFQGTLANWLQVEIFFRHVGYKNQGNSYKLQQWLVYHLFFSQNPFQMILFCPMRIHWDLTGSTCEVMPHNVILTGGFLVWWTFFHHLWL